ncbi:MAG: molybdopterin-dependent oxidoreductase, partial [Deltaproteobacteria bacterium]|nr:molybdopterin-dependent oxidoreductase [Deltaproteobacteria bacterium]
WAINLTNDQRPCLVHPLLGGPNSFGAALLSLPEQDDLLNRLESGRVKMLVCLEADPLLEAPQAERFSAALNQLDKLAVLDCLPTQLSAQADLFIPTRTMTESSGTFINNEGRLRRYHQVMEPGEPLKVTGNENHPPREFSSVTPGSDPLAAMTLLQILLEDGSSLDQLHQQLVCEFPRLAGLEKPVSVTGVRVQEAPARNWGRRDLPEQPEGTLQLIVAPARYGSDLLSRFSDKLEPRFVSARIMLNPQDAETRNLQDGDRVVLDMEVGSFTLPLVCHPALAVGCALVENSAALPQLIPGAGISYCQVNREGAYD